MSPEDEAKQALIDMCLNDEMVMLALFHIHSLVFSDHKARGSEKEDISRCLEDLGTGLPSPLNRHAGSMVSTYVGMLKDLYRMRCIYEMIEQLPQAANEDKN